MIVRRWTPAEIAIVKRDLKHRVFQKVIAHKLGRTEQSVSQLASKLKKQALEGQARKSMRVTVLAADWEMIRSISHKKCRPMSSIIDEAIQNYLRGATP